MREPLVIAHRGGAGVWPENTAVAFAAADRAGCVLETDVRRTADGVAVCFHDDTTARVTGEDHRVADLTLARLRAGCAAAGLPLVTVAELLGSLPRAQVVLDVKDPAVVAALATDVRRTRAASRVCATGTFDPALARLRAAVGPELALGLGWFSLAALAAGSTRRPAGAQWAFVPARLASPRVIARARRAGLRVAVWTVDEPAAAQRFRALGAEALTTDRPDRLLPVLQPGRSAPGRAADPATGAATSSTSSSTTTTDRSEVRLCAS